MIEVFLPTSFQQALIAVTLSLSLLLYPVSFAPRVRAHTVKMISLLLIVSVTLLADHWSTYFAAIFIISTSVTELDFLLSLASIIRGGRKQVAGFQSSLHFQAWARVPRICWL